MTSDIRDGAHPTPGELHWHLVARGIVAAFLALLALLASFFKYVSSPWPLVGVSGLILTYNAFFFLTPWHRAWPKAAMLLALILDVFALTTYLHFSGDIENPLVLAYSLPVVAGAVILSRRAAFLLAGLATFQFITLILMTILDAFPVHVDHYHLALVGDLNLHDRIDPDLNSQGWNYILTHLLILMAVLFGSAHGFGILSERLREKERDLQNENERLLLLLSILPESVVLLSQEGVVLHANPAARKFLNGSESRSVSTLDQNLGLADRFAHFSGTKDEFETTFHDRILEHALARRSASGPVAWVFRDTTDQRRLTAEVMHRSKMIDLGLLAAGIAHEIGNPLSSMSAILEVMEMKHPEAGLFDRVRALESHIDRISQIVQNITGYARPSAGTCSPHEAGVLLAKALQIFKFHDKAKHLNVESETRPDSAMMLVVEDQVVQVLLNLLLNAADACNGRGTVSAKVRATPAEVRISITDTGTGITEDTRRRLFTPFFTTKEQGKGVGLGLFISESIARGHGGRIDIASTPGAGSTFTLCMPRAPGGS
ncbi:MAG TPA: ATP-binding protein [Planctomycetota bacterium]|nr:ATP-binding protein [Planctomycetota bacterium]